MPSPLFAGHDGPAYFPATAEDEYVSTRCWCQYPILTLDPFVCYGKPYNSPVRGFLKESCFTLSGGLRVDIIRPHPRPQLRTNGPPALRVSASLDHFNREDDDKTHPLNSLVQLLDRVRGRDKSTVQLSPLTYKERRYRQWREHNMRADLPGQQHHKNNRLAHSLHDSKAWHARSNAMPDSRACGSSADITSPTTLQSHEESISPTAGGSSRRKTTDKRREGFSFHSEEEALKYAQDMRDRQDEPYLHVDGTDWDTLGRELTRSEAESMRNNKTSRFSRTSSNASRRQSGLGEEKSEQARYRQDSKVMAVARKVSKEVVRKVSGYFRPPATRRKTIG